MSPLLKILKSPAFEALIISFLVHVFLFNICIFTFSVLPESHKPTMSFLGSILQENEMTGISLENFEKMAPYTAKERIIKPFGQPKIDKPLTENEISDPGKVIIKPSQLNRQDELNNKASAEGRETLGIDLDIEPYKPLSLP